MTWSPRNLTTQKPFEEGMKVRFKETYLLKEPEQIRKRFEGRVGTVSGYRMGADDPIVDFPRDGRRKEQRLFEPRSQNLELAPVRISERRA